MTEPAAVALVFAGGDIVPTAAAAALPAARWVVAADAGAHLADALGYRPDVVVGDLDSVDPTLLDRLTALGVTVERHPPAKDETDLELAVARAAATGARQVVVVGGSGGRLDHLLANALLLASPRFADLDIQAVTAHGRLWVVRRRAQITGQVGELVTLLAVHGPASGVRTTGLRWSLGGETLAPGSSRGVSNELVESSAEIEVAHGVVLVVLPGEQGSHPHPTAPP